MYVYVILGLVPVLYAIIRHWRRTHVKVNCWFCALNNFIPIKCQDGWVCKHCEQYNGFKPDGDYNREIAAQSDLSLFAKLSFCAKPQSSISSVNGLCDECNQNQEMKISQLASFEPINPENFDDEIENFSYHLERAYKLCPTCELVVEEKLIQTKSRVLDINLQVTGKRHQNTQLFSSQSFFVRNMVKVSKFLSAAFAILLTLSLHTTLHTEHVFLNLFADTEKEERMVKVALESYPIPAMSYFLPSSAICLKSDFNQSLPLPRPFSKILNGHFEMCCDIARLNSVPICLSGLILLGISSWQSGHKSGLFYWIAFSGSVLFIQMQVHTGIILQIAQILQGLFALLVLASSCPATRPKKSKSLSKRNITTRNSSKPTKLQKGCGLPHNSVAPRSQAFEAITSPNTGTVLKGQSLEKAVQDVTNLTSANYLTLPVRSASSSSQRTLGSLSVLDNTDLLSTSDIMSSASQEDARSDASVDSAFSNSDSLNLDAADSVNSSYQHSSGRNVHSQDGDVHSLIETLSIGSRQSRRTSCEFKTRQYGKVQKRTSLLSPPKLANIMNDSMRSGIWRNTRSRMQESQAPMVPESTVQILSRPSSPCGSVRSQTTVRTQASVRSLSPPSSFHPAASPAPTAWNGPASPTVQRNTLSVCLPPNPLASHHSFGNFASTLPGSPLHHQVFYTPYGLFHQMGGPYGNPTMFVMPPQSPPFSSRSPASSYGSEFSPRSCSSISPKDSSFQYDSEQDFSPKSSRGERRTKSGLSSSFIESVWQSRFPIMYTTLCYLLLGSIVCAFSFGEGITKMFSDILVWK